MNFISTHWELSFVKASRENRSFNTVLKSADNTKAPIRIRGYNDELRW